MKWEIDEATGVHETQAGHLRLRTWDKYQRAYWEVKCAGFVIQTGVAATVAEGKDAARAAAHYLAADVMEALT
jgi:hypothetical protein